MHDIPLSSVPSALITLRVRYLFLLQKGKFSPSDLLSDTIFQPELTQR